MSSHNNLNHRHRHPSSSELRNFVLQHTITVTRQVDSFQQIPDNRSSCVLREQPPHVTKVHYPRSIRERDATTQLSRSAVQRVKEIGQRSKCSIKELYGTFHITSPIFTVPWWSNMTICHMSWIVFLSHSRSARQCLMIKTDTTLDQSGPTDWKQLLYVCTHLRVISQ